MSAIPWILISVGILIILLLFLVVIFSKGKKYQTDYYTFFIMGVTWLPFGILVRIFFPEIFIGNLFIVLGAMYTLIGLVHKKEWKKNKKLTSKEQKLKLIASVILGIIVLAILVLYYIFRG